MAITDQGREQMQPFEVFERLDEEQVRQEVAGVYVKDLVYQFENQGRTVTGLSIKGVEEGARLMVRHGYDIEAEKAELEETADEFRASCKVTFTAPNGKKLVTYGYSRQSKKQFSGQVNEFAFVQAKSKAQRNALRTVIPEKFMTMFIEQFLKEGKTRKIDRGEAERFTPTPPLVQSIRPAHGTDLGKEDYMLPSSKEIPKIPYTGDVEPNASFEEKTRVAVRIKLELPRFIGADMMEYGPFKPEDVCSIPKLNAQILEKQNCLQIIVDSMAAKDEQEKIRKGMELEVGVLEWAELNKDGQEVGTITLTREGIDIVFREPLNMAAGAQAIKGFLCKKILDTKRERKNGDGKVFDYTLEEHDGLLHSISIMGEVDANDLKDLVGPCSWASKTVLDRMTAKPATEKQVEKK